MYRKYLMYVLAVVFPIVPYIVCKQLHHGIALNVFVVGVLVVGSVLTVTFDMPLELLVIILSIQVGSVVYQIIDCIKIIKKYYAVKILSK